MSRWGIIAFGIALLALSRAAEAQTLAVDCTSNPQAGYLASQLAGIAPNTVVQITGTCLGDVTVTTDGLTFESSFVQPVEPQSLDFSFGGDAINGRLEIAGAHNIVLNGLELDLAAGESSNAVLWIHDQADVTLQANTVTFAASNGIVVADASLAFQSGFLNYAGAAGSAASVVGLLVENGATAVLGFPNNNGTPVGSAASIGYYDFDYDGGICSCTTLLIIPSYWVNIADTGIGIRVMRGGQLSAYDSTASGSVEGAEGASLHLEGVPVQQIQISGKSALWLQNGGITAGLSVLDGSSAILLGAAMQNLQASAGSTIALASGNVVSGSVQIDHESSLVEQSGAFYGAQPYQDIILGPGLIQMGSAAELGNGYGNGLVWQGNLTVQQNSAIHFSGGVSITGSLTLEQASNAFFDAGSGGANSLSGGVSCVFSNVLASHVYGGAGVTPPIATMASATGATSPQCLGF